MAFTTEMSKSMREIRYDRQNFFSSCVNRKSFAAECVPVGNVENTVVETRKAIKRQG